jgi:N-methylhydantoinase A
VGQGYELDVPVEPGEDGALAARRFGELHAARTGFTLDREVEIVGARHVASSVGRAPAFRRRPAAPNAEPLAATGAIVDDGSALDMRVAGATTVVLPDATLFVADGWSARSLDVGGWMLERR